MKKKYIVIPGEQISRKKFLEELDNYRITQYRDQLENIRLSNLSEDQKRIQSSFIYSHIHAIENNRVRN